MNRKFTPKNEGFSCLNCGFLVGPAPQTFRNHCPKCLTSRHVDNYPGDRANSCRGLMPTLSYQGTNPDQLKLIQRCLACGHIQPNRTSPDDDLSQLF